MINPDRKKDTLWESLRPFVFAGISGLTATSCVQPIDNIKVRIQTLSEEAGKSGKQAEKTNIFKTGKYMIKNQGFLSIYKGLDAGLLRQLFYATSRLGVFTYLSEQWTLDGHQLSFFERLGLSLFSGFVGAVVGNPLDITMVRFQSELMLPIEQRRNYKNVFDGIYRITKDEGVFTLWRGFPSFACRVMALTSGQLTTFEEAKKLANNIRGKQESDFITRLL